MPDGLPSPLADLPGVFTPVALREGADALARAAALAPARGAGTLAWVGARGRAEAALVLEPERPLAEARLALLAAATALADALAAYGPPELPLGFHWPAALVVNDGLCGRLRLTMSPDVGEAGIPDWIVVGFEVALEAPPGSQPGDAPERTTLAEEGFSGVEVPALVAGWARHLMAGLDEWEARGPQRVAERFLARLIAPAAPEGGRRGIDPLTADLLLVGRDVTQRLPLLVPA